eukprot:9540488-Heterocapsa_arctica.AAC.1
MGSHLRCWRCRQTCRRCHTGSRRSSPPSVPEGPVDAAHDALRRARVRAAPAAQVLGSQISSE